MSNSLQSRWSARLGALVVGLSMLALAARAEAGPVCPADFDGDGAVGSADLATLLGSWGGCAGCAADLDGNGAVGSGDLALLLGAWGPCPVVVNLQEPGTQEWPPGAPEPASFALIDGGGGDGEHGVHLFSGEFVCRAVDMEVMGRGIDFVWARKHRSRIGQTGDFGPGWDSSYELTVRSSGAHRLVRDGNGREDVYSLQPDGTWLAPEMFRVLSANPDGTLSLHFPHGGQWDFRALDGSAAAGKIAAIVDRNGNAITFAYDALGRLEVVRDTLHVQFNPREYTITRNSAGRVIAVTDWTGRQVLYAYYALGEPGGSPGDLKSVTTPAVTGTPHGNDFPAGKTTVYTYSTGFGDERLNHNLLTITDPKGQTWLTNTYAPTLDPGDPDFDRVVRQTYAGGGGGGAGGLIDYVYAAQTPSPDNGGAVMKAIVNDRAGNVSECLYDAGNRLVSRREYTGRAIADLPTTETVNRPVNPLRADDPEYFEERFEYTPDSLCSVHYAKNGATNVFDRFDMAGADRRSHPNVIQMLGIAGPLGGDQPEIAEFFTYDPAHNFALTHTDARGNVTTHEYDVQGNRIRTTHRIPSIVEEWTYNSAGQMTSHRWPDNGEGHLRLDTFEYYDGQAAGHQHGMLHREILDSGGAGDPGALQITTTYEYDALGRVTRVVDPNGRDELCLYNALDQVVRRQSRPPDDDPSHRIAMLLFYDANDNLVREDHENRDETGALQPNSHFTTTYEYDELDRLTRCTREVDGPDVVVEEFEHDANDNCTLVRKGEATGGGDPFNVVRTIHDERDLPFLVIRGEGGPVHATDQYDYTPTGLVRAVHGGVEDPTPATHTWEYDGYDRPVHVVDAMGNETFHTYDPNGNALSTRREGEFEDGPGGAANVRLSESFSQYDEMDRISHHDNAWFDAATQAPVDDGKRSTTIVWNDISRVQSVIDDRGNTVIVRGFDRMHRLLRGRRSMTYESTHSYDANSNLVQTLETEFSSAGLAPQQFLTTYEHDGLDRLTRCVDSAGGASSWAYDSRSNMTREVDGVGIETGHVYDGLSRRTQSFCDLDGDGAPSAADIVSSTTWDRSSRVRQRIDDLGNVTEHSYDSLDRRIQTTRADLTIETMSYDARDNVVQSVDANGSVHTFAWDAMDRAIAQQAIPGPGVAPTPIDRSYAYDGLSRLIRALEAGSSVERSFDSLDNCVLEHQNGAAVASAYDGAGNRVAIAGSSGWMIGHTHDSADRVVAVTDGMIPYVTLDYIGGRLSGISHRNGVTSQIEWDGALGTPPPPPPPPGDQGDREIIATRHTMPNAQTLDHRVYAWDAAGRKSSAAVDRGPLLPARMLWFAHDGADRLIRSKVEEGPAVLRDTLFTLDGMGNRITVKGIGTTCSGAYTMSAATPEPADRQMNQYTATPCDTRQYDRSGNLVQRMGAGPGVALEYDALDRLVSVRPSAPGSARIASYEYDALDRRIRKTVDPDSPAAVVTEFLYDGADVVEQSSPGGTPYVFVWNAAMDLGGRAPVAMVSGAGEFHLHCDDLGSVVAVTDSAGALVERCWYDDYGRVTITDSAGATIPASLAGNPYLFHAMRRDAETGLYQLDSAGSFDPNGGRFINGNSDSYDMGWWGKRRRVVLSGHSGGWSFWGDDNGEIPFDHLEGASNYAGNSPVSRRDVKRMGGKIALCQRDGAPVIEWTFEKGWPVRWEGPELDSTRAKIPRTVLKSFFQTGDKPTQNQRSARKGDRLSLVGFGSYSVSRREARHGRNPQTGRTMRISSGQPTITENTKGLAVSLRLGPANGGVERPGALVMADLSIDEREMTTGLDVEYRLSGGGGGGGGCGGEAAARKRPGRVKYGDITLKRGHTAAGAGLAWMAPEAIGNRRSGKQYIYIDCFPVSYSRAPERPRTFQTISNVSKSKHDAAMAAIQNTR